MLEKLRVWLLGLSVLVVLAGVIFWLFTQSSGGGPFAGNTEGQLKPVDFANLAHVSGPDSRAYLLCDVQICPNAIPDAGPTELPYNSAAVRKALFAVSDPDPRSQTVFFDLAVNQYDFVIKTPGRPFPFVASFRFIDTKLGYTKVIAYSHAPVGDSDPQDHEAFIETWIEKMEYLLSSGQAS